MSGRETTSQTMRASLERATQRHWCARLVFGVALLGDGAGRALRSHSTQMALLRSVRWIALLSVALYALAFALEAPFHLLRALVAWVTDNQRILLIFDWVTASIRSLFVALLFAMPDAALYLARYWFPGPMDRLFKESLDSFMSQIENQQFRLAATKATQSLDAALSDADTPETRARTSKNFNDFLKRYWARFRILLGVWLLSFVPIFGILAWPAATFVYMSEKVNWPFALFLLVLSFLSRRMHNYIRGPLLRTVFQIRALSRELVDPYLSRSQMNPDKKHEWLQRNDAVILGFTLPLFALLYIPLLGPALYFALANSAAARLILEIIDPVDFQEEGAIPGVPTRGLCESRLGYSYGAPVIQFLLVVATQADTLFDKALLHLSLQTEAVISKIEAVKTFDHIMQDVGAFLRNLEGEKIKRE